MDNKIKISDFAKLTRTTLKTILYYHKIGLLKEAKRSDNGYRMYGAEDLARMRIIKHFRKLGLELKQIKEILGDTKESHKNMVEVLMLFMWIVLFIPAGTIKYWEAWIFWTGFSVLTLFIAFYFSIKNPEFLARRSKVKGNKSVYKAPAFLKLFFLSFILPGIDYRFQWSKEVAWLAIVANIIAFLAYIFIIIVFMKNSYASTVIQVETEQKVIADGIYFVVRHPMYTGMITMSLFMPLALGSYVALIPALLIIPITVYRIRNEEEVLLKELTGYKEYCIKTPYKVIPFIW